MGWPQYTYLALTLFGFALVVEKNGQPRDNYSIVDESIGAAVALILLYAGGFFG